MMLVQPLSEDTDFVPLADLPVVLTVETPLSIECDRANTIFQNAHSASNRMGASLPAHSGVARPSDCAEIVAVETAEVVSAPDIDTRKETVPGADVLEDDRACSNAGKATILFQKDLIERYGGAAKQRDRKRRTVGSGV